MMSHNLALYIFTIMLFFMFLIASLGFLNMMFNNFIPWSHNSSMPLVTAKAKIISKRFRTFQDNQTFGDMLPSYNYSTLYYITFQLEDGEELEFSVTAVEYEELQEGQQGKINYQGNRFLGFEVEIEKE
ncbi:hypothetical protein J2Z44_004169 [Clostridium punense]|uniref:DUF2500 domain-containing protein n=1 Tax=Clostridium punense TaxID=1054297 RepID=A0ABS4K963_9CLOT|nr:MULTISPECIES: DUF2500 domain-containing protein [Clostridium]MBP2024309.1 hypothetical protein [Clostridium punense]